MDFYEAEGKRLFQRFGIPTDPGLLYRGEETLKQARFPCVVKAQVLSGKRGKAGGVRFASNEEELGRAVADISALTIGGRPVEGILINDKLSIAREHYLGYTLDTVQKRLLLLYTPCGGMDIEQVAAETPEKLLRMDVTEGFNRSAFQAGIQNLGLTEPIRLQLGQIAEQLYTMFCELDATTVEINPLAQTAEGRLTAADAKLVIDDNALSRQGDYTLLPRREESRGVTARAREAGLSYVELDPGGTIGIIAGGAGIGMATVDTVKHYGGRPFNFMDLGGGVTSEKTRQALSLLLDISQVKAVLVNVFGGINNCLDMAKGVCQAAREHGNQTLVVVKSRGFSQEEGWALYDELGLPQVRYGTTDDAVKLLLSGLEAAQ